MITIEPIALLQDNYAYLVRRGKRAVVIDPSEATTVYARVRAQELKLEAVLNTHHHWDHVGGNSDLAARFQCGVVAAEHDRARIAAFTQGVQDGQSIEIAGMQWEVLAVPGHTLGAIAWYLPEARAVFTGDTLFVLGCGRMFEGTPAQMWQSLERLASLPGETRIYCGHEYAAANARFALSLGADNGALKTRKLGTPSVPAPLEIERTTNPFLRIADPEFRRACGLSADPVEAFAELRRRKDTFS